MSFGLVEPQLLKAPGVKMGEMVVRGVRPGMKDIGLSFIILDVGKPTKTKEGREVRTAKVADRSGSINLSL